jgi:hypothetical protein
VSPLGNKKADHIDAVPYWCSTVCAEYSIVVRFFDYTWHLH